MDPDFRKRLESSPTRKNGQNKNSQNTFETPRKKKAASDRFIPKTPASDMAAKYAFVSSEHKSPTKQPRKPGEPEPPKEPSAAKQLYSDILVHELLPGASTFQTPSKRAANLFNFADISVPVRPLLQSPFHKAYSTTSLSVQSRMLLQSPKHVEKLIPKTPYKVLDAPELQDDFYLNLVDWSSTNILGVGLGTCVYLWNATSSKVTKLCDLGPQDSISSVCWVQRGTHIAIGTNRGLVQLWDVQKFKKVRQFTGHQARVGSMAWNVDSLTTGSRDRNIYVRDVRSPAEFSRKLIGHRQEVCGLKWSHEETQLASGGNDNKLLIWDARSDVPIWKLTNHTAAVKAIAWSPHQHGLLASGGGTADRTIRFWNTTTGLAINHIDTGSQVCNLAWSKNSNEFISTHGYSQNQILVWKYPKLEQIASLTGHTFRVLYLAMSPDGQNIVTGAGDETLRFWTVFNKGRSRREQGVHTLSLR